MRRSQLTESQRRAIVLEGQKRQTNIEKLCEEHQISPTTYYKWRSEFSLKQDEHKKRLQMLEKENAKLKKMYLETQLDK